MVDENVLDNYEVALYLIEHDDFLGEIIIDKQLLIKGEANMCGENMTIRIEADIMNLK